MSKIDVEHRKNIELFCYLCLNLVEKGTATKENKDTFIKYFKTAFHLSNKEWYKKEYNICASILEKDLISKKDMDKLVLGVRHMVNLFNGAYDSKYNRALRASLINQ